MQQTIIDWFEKEGRDLPWREPGFTPWASLVSEFMLQQTPVSRVIPRLKQWLQRWPTPSSLAQSSPGDAVRAWENLGYPRRALWLHQCAVIIVERFHGEVPSNVTDLLSLPGVGPYTARAIAVFAFGEHHPVVDTNIRRVIARHNQGLSDQGPPSATKDLQAMQDLLPNPALSPAFNAGMMELGALICTARNPQCDLCPISNSCAWRKAGYPTPQSPTKPRQKKYQGSDRQARGAVLSLVRSSATPVAYSAMESCWENKEQLARAISSLISDGLIVKNNADKYNLPA